MTVPVLKIIATSNGSLIRMGKAKESEIPASMQLTEASLGIWENQTIAWPEDFAALSRLLEVNPWHNACCRVKAQDVTSQGWTLEDDKGKTDNPPKELLSFFENPNPEKTLGEVLNDCWIDYEATGNFDLEVARQKGGKKYPGALYHVPSQTVRKLKDGRYLQMRGGLLRYFLKFGTLEQDIKDPKWKGQDQLVLNEIISLENYAPRSTYYGLPDAITALGAITGHVRQRDANIKYFENGMMAEFIIMIEGGTLDDDSEKEIKEILDQMKGSEQAHRTCVLHIGDKEAKIHIEKLTPELNYTQQRLYRLDNRDEIIQAHRVPPKLVGVEDKSGGLQASQGVQLDIYYQNVVTPAQKRLGHRLTNTLIRQGFGIEGWNLVFTAKVLEDKKENADVDAIYLDRGVLLPNEVRAIRWPEKDPLPDGDTSLLEKPAVIPAEADLKLVKALKTGEGVEDLPTRDIEADLLSAMLPHLTSFKENATARILTWDGTITKRLVKRSWFRKTDPQPDKVILSDIMRYLEGQWAGIEVPLAEVVWAAKIKGGERGVKTQYKKLGVKQEFKLTNPKLLEYYRTEAAQDIKGIGETTMTQVRAALMTSAENGEVAVGQLSERVKGVMDGITTQRAELIAEQEVTNAYSHLQHESRVRLGVMAKTWTSQFDDHVRPDHQVMNGVTVGVNMYFTLPDGSVGLYPRARSLSSKESIRCRCDIIDVVDTGWDIPTDPWSGN